MANLELLGEYSAPEGIINIVGFDATNAYGIDEEGKHYPIVELALGIDYIKITKGAYAFAQPLPEHASFIPIKDNPEPSIKTEPQDISESVFKPFAPISGETPVLTHLELPNVPPQNVNIAYPRPNLSGMDMSGFVNAPNPNVENVQNDYSGMTDYMASPNTSVKYPNNAYGFPQHKTPTEVLNKSDEYAHLIAFHKIIGEKNSESYPVEIPITVTLPYNPFNIIEMGIGAGLDAGTLIARMFNDAGINDAPILKAIADTLMGVSNEPEVFSKKQKPAQKPIQTQVSKPMPEPEPERITEKQKPENIQNIQNIQTNQMNETIGKIKKPKISKILSEASAKINKISGM